MPSKKVSMRASMSNQTTHFGIMGGLYNRKISGRSSQNRTTSRLVIPTTAKLGMQFMQKHNLLSKNPQGSGGVGPMNKVTPCNCTGLGKTEPGHNDDGHHLHDHDHDVDGEVHDHGGDDNNNNDHHHHDHDHDNNLDYSDEHHHDVEVSKECLSLNGHHYGKCTTNYGSGCFTGKNRNICCDQDSWVDGSGCIDQSGVCSIDKGSCSLFTSCPGGSLRWEYGMALGSDSVVATPDGAKLFTTDRNGNIYALDATNGGVVWTHNTGQYEEPMPVLSNDGSLVFVKSSYFVRALDLSSGDTSWNYSMNGATSMAMSSSGEILFVSSATKGGPDGHLRAIHPMTAEKLWQHDSYDSYPGPPVSSPDGNLVFWSTELNVYVLDSSGSVKFQKKKDSNGPTNFATFSTDSDILYYGHHGNVYAINMTTNTLDWTCNTGDLVDISSGAHSAHLLSPDGSTLFVGTSDGNIKAVDTSNGNVNWSYSTGLTVGIVLSSSGKTIFVGTRQGVKALAQLDAAMPTKLWAADLSGALCSGCTAAPPVLSLDDNIVFYRNNYNVYALERWTGSVKWNHAVSPSSHPRPHTLSPDGATLFIGTNVNAFALTTGIPPKPVV